MKDNKIKLTKKLAMLLDTALAELDNSDVWSEDMSEKDIFIIENEKEKLQSKVDDYLGRNKVNNNTPKEYPVIEYIDITPTIIQRIIEEDKKGNKFLEYHMRILSLSKKEIVSETGEEFLKAYGISYYRNENLFRWDNMFLV